MAGLELTAVHTAVNAQKPVILAQVPNAVTVLLAHSTQKGIVMASVGAKMITTDRLATNPMVDSVQVPV